VANHGRLGISRGKHTERLCEACVQINQTHEYGASKLNRKCLLTHLREPAASQRMEAPVKALYAALALFFVAAPTASSARSPDLSLSPPLCSDDYYEDTAGQCRAVSAGEVLTIEAILAKYGVIVVDGEVIVLYFDELDDMPVGSIQPRNEDAVPTDDPANEPDTIASRIIIVDPPSEIDGEAADDIATTGPSAQSIPVAAEPVDDNRIE
jgi:hypothetical protein